MPLKLSPLKLINFWIFLSLQYFVLKSVLGQFSKGSFVFDLTQLKVDTILKYLMSKGFTSLLILQFFTLSKGGKARQGGQTHVKKNTDFVKAF